MFKKVLCQKCLKVEKYSNDKHNGLIKCSCGGEFCGCEDCNNTIKKLKKGITEKNVLVTKTNILKWNENYGILQ